MGYAKSASLALAFGSTGSECSKEYMALKYYCRLPFNAWLGFANVILSQRSVMFVSKVNRGPLSRSVCFPQSGSAATVSIAATFMARRYRVTIPAPFYYFHVALLTKSTNPSSVCQKRTASVERKLCLWFHQGCFNVNWCKVSGSATHSAEPLNKIANAL